MCADLWLIAGPIYYAASSGTFSRPYSLLLQLECKMFVLNSI